MEIDQPVDFVQLDTLVFARYAVRMYAMCSRDRQFAVISEWFLAHVTELWSLLERGDRIRLESPWPGKDVRYFEARWRWTVDGPTVEEEAFSVASRRFGWVSWLGWPIAGEAIASILALFVFLARRHPENRAFVAGLLSVANGLGRAHLRREIGRWGQRALAQRLVKTAIFEATNPEVQARFYTRQ